LLEKHFISRIEKKYKLSCSKCAEGNKQQGNKNQGTALATATKIQHVVTPSLHEENCAPLIADFEETNATEIYFLVRSFGSPRITPKN